MYLHLILRIRDYIQSILFLLSFYYLFYNGNFKNFYKNILPSFENKFQVANKCKQLTTHLNYFEEEKVLTQALS